MYVVKVGEYYVNRYNETLMDIKLSKETMLTFPKHIAEIIAKKLNGEIETINEEVTNE